MRKIIKRSGDIKRIKKLVRLFPVTAITGPRQCGKTFLSKEIKYDHYFDLENPRDMARLKNPQISLEDLEGVIVIDEIQHRPELFSLLRYLVDGNKKQKYLILGSASEELVKKSSESLAGRIAYYHLGGFSLVDVGISNIDKLWLRGGLPISYLSRNDEESFLWLENYVTAFLERDIPRLGITIPAYTLRRFWTMLSHYHGQVINFSELGRSFGVSDMTVRKYIEILAGTFMVRVVQPWYVNAGKRLVKRPKIYIRDSGVFHSLTSIGSKKQLFTHNKLGASWEGFAFEYVSKVIGKRAEELYFWSTHTGAEIDLFWQSKGKNWGIEFKYTDVPKITKSMHVAASDLKLAHLYVIYPGKDSFKLSRDITALSIQDASFSIQ